MAAGLAREALGILEPFAVDCTVPGSGGWKAARARTAAAGRQKRGFLACRTEIRCTYLSLHCPD